MLGLSSKPKIKREQKLEVRLGLVPSSAPQGRKGADKGALLRVFHCAGRHSAECAGPTGRSRELEGVWTVLGFAPRQIAANIILPFTSFFFLLFFIIPFPLCSTFLVWKRAFSVRF